jgi:hypothetical protein
VALEALEGGRRVINIAGVHGVGTAAVRLVLKNRKILSVLSEQLLHLDRTNAFQVLIEIERIEHDPTKGSYAKEG